MISKKVLIYRKSRAVTRTARPKTLTSPHFIPYSSSAHEAVMQSAKVMAYVATVANTTVAIRTILFIEFHPFLCNLFNYYITNYIFFQYIK